VIIRYEHANRSQCSPRPCLNPLRWCPVRVEL
jgi:hypothetical protein